MECAETHSGSPGWQISFTACWTLSWGPTWDRKGCTYMESKHLAADWVTESEWGHATEACLAPWPFTRIDDFTARGFLTSDLRGRH
jgi:hypothetical protein